MRSEDLWLGNTGKWKEKSDLHREGDFQPLNKRPKLNSISLMHSYNQLNAQTTYLNVGTPAMEELGLNPLSLKFYLKHFALVHHFKTNSSGE